MIIKKRIVFILFSIFCGLSSSAQDYYYSGFDNATEQAGWVEYKKAATTFSHWNYTAFGAYTDPNCIQHDFSPSAGITLTDNWFVSPAFDLSEGGTLDSLRYKFSGFSVPEVGDTIAVYLLTGSQDPDLATSKQLLFDFRGPDYVTDDVYRILMDIPLTPTTETAYLAIRYRNSNCSSNWLTVNFDNVAVKNGTFAELPDYNWGDSFTAFPNPSSGEFTLIGAHAPQAVRVFNIAGKEVKCDIFISSNDTVHVNMGTVSSGIYMVQVQEGTKTRTLKVTVQ